MKINQFILNICPFLSSLLLPKNLFWQHFFCQNFQAGACPSLSSSVKIFTLVPAPDFLLLLNFLVGACPSSLLFFTGTLAFGPVLAFLLPLENSVDTCTSDFPFSAKNFAVAPALVLLLPSIFSRQRLPKPLPFYRKLDSGACPSLYSPINVCFLPSR